MRQRKETQINSRKKRASGLLMMLCGVRNLMIRLLKIRYHDKYP
jgi:hypothetical protein